MTEQPPYTGNTSPEMAGPPQPAFPVEYAPFPVVWHSRGVLIAVTAFALLALILTIVGGLGFPGGPVEGIYWIGLLVDLVAVVIAGGVFIAVETVRNATPGRRALPENTRFSIFAIVGIVMSVIALVAWASSGLEQLVMLLQGVRTRYMYATGGLFFAGIPWALGAIFGAWGFRPRGNSVTYVLAALAMIIWALLAAVTTAHAIVYGLDLSD